MKDAHAEVEIRAESAARCSPRRLTSGPVLISELADRQKLPKKFLEAILLELKRARPAAQQEGEGRRLRSSGGKPTDITVGQVIRVLDGPLGADALRQCDRLSKVRRMPRREDLWCPPGHEGGPRRDRRDSRQHDPGRPERPGCARSSARRAASRAAARSPRARRKTPVAN